MNSPQTTSAKRKALKRAEKTFSFWYSVLLETEYMNDLEYRQEFQSALMTVREIMENSKRD